MGVQPAYPSAQAIAELGREAQLAQIQSLDALDAKAGTFVGLAGVLLGLIFTSPVATSRWSLLLSIGAGFLGFAIVLLSLAALPRSVRFNPNPIALAAYLTQPADETYSIAVASIEQALIFNQDLSKFKRRLLQYGTVIAVVGLILITIGLIESAERGIPPPAKRATIQLRASL